jgi:hypothetical protein
MAQAPWNSSFVVLGSKGSVGETRSGGLNPGFGPTWLQIGPNLDQGNNNAVTALSYGASKLGTGMYSVYAGFADGRLFQTDRNSLNFTAGAWTELPHPWGNRPVTGIASQPGSGVVWVTVGAFNDGTGTGQVFESPDYGKTWLDLTGNLPKIPANAIVLNGSTPYVGNDDGVYVGVPGPGNYVWTRLDTGLPHVQVLNLQIQNYSGTNIMAVATHGRGAWLLTLPAPPAPQAAAAVQGVADTAIALTSFPDPGIAETDTVSIDWGDGTPSIPPAAPSRLRDRTIP